MHRIQELWRTFKGFGEVLAAEWGVAIIVIAVGVGAFGLGRLSALESAKPVISIVKAPELSQPRGMHIGGLIVASRSGNKYFYPWCSGAQSISESNKIWFRDVAAARAAGYEPAKNCRGLK